VLLGQGYRTPRGVAMLNVAGEKQRTWRNMLSGTSLTTNLSYQAMKPGLRGEKPASSSLNYDMTY
jgi:hypothetical protein